MQAVVQKAPASSEAVQAREILRGGTFHFTVQVGAVVSRANALRLESELRRRGYRSQVTETTRQGRLFHRVRVGRFTTRQEAKTQAQRLRQDGFPAKIFP